MAVLWLVLKILLWVLLGLMALLLVGLVMPVTAALGWSGEKGAEASVWVLGLHVRLWPRREKPEKKAKKSREKRAGKPAGRPAGENVSDAVPGEGATPPPQENTPQEAQSGKKSAAPEKRFQFTIETLQGMISLAGGFMRRVLAGLKIHAIRVYLPVHRQDAAATALAVGRLHGVLGAALGALQNLLDLRFEQYDLEPDYTGREQGKAFFSCKITAHSIIMVIAVIWALVRLKKENII